MKSKRPQIARKNVVVVSVVAGTAALAGIAFLIWANSGTPKASPKKESGSTTVAKANKTSTTTPKEKGPPVPTEDVPKTNPTKDLEKNVKVPKLELPPNKEVAKDGGKGKQEEEENRKEAKDKEKVKEKEKEKDKNVLNGTWEQKKITVGGVQDKTPAGTFVLVFDGDKYLIKMNGKVFKTSSILYDADAPTSRLMMTDETGPDVGKMWPFLFKLSEDKKTLTFAFNGKGGIPTDFDGTASDDFVWECTKK